MDVLKINQDPEHTFRLLKSSYLLYPASGLKCYGCNLGQNYYSKGYRCFHSGYFFHEECAKSDRMICTIYHPHRLQIKVVSRYENANGKCNICRGKLPKIYYDCLICNFSIDLVCAKKEVTTTIEGSKTHTHPLSLVPDMIMFTCHLCGLLDDWCPYVCKLCGLSFHKNCGESTPEINYSCHPKHILKRLTRVPCYSNGNCSMCGNNLHNVFYHCSICKFSLDVQCAKNPPRFTLDQAKIHEHSLILMPQRYFVCSACGMDDDPNPYVCPQCNFMIHRSCIDIPRVIKINRHAHRISYKHCLDVGDWNCGVCHKEINWTYGAYSCPTCQDFSVHLRCATRFGIWDGVDLEGISENTLEIESYEVIEEGIIKHFSHEDHILKLKEESDANDEYKSCKACSYPIFASPFYSCMECDDFILHKKCAHLPKRKIDSLYNLWTTLTTNNNDNKFICSACQNFFEGFRYISDNGLVKVDVRCGSVSETFIHESHPLHPLFMSHSMVGKFCNACGDKIKVTSLSCDECEFVLDIKCSILPNLVKNKIDKEHFLSLCYGEKTSEQFWCEVCEEKLNPDKWFYSCNYCGITFHIKCTVADFLGMKFQGVSESTHNGFILNSRMTRPICDACMSRCQFTFFLKQDDTIFCSIQCLTSTL